MSSASDYAANYEKSLGSAAAQTHTAAPSHPPPPPPPPPAYTDPQQQQQQDYSHQWSAYWAAQGYAQQQQQQQSAHVQPQHAYADYYAQQQQQQHQGYAQQHQQQQAQQPQYASYPAAHAYSSYPYSQQQPQQSHSYPQHPSSAYATYPPPPPPPPPATAASATAYPSYAAAAAGATAHGARPVVGVPALSSSFVAATASSMGTATAKPVITGRGPVDLTSSTDESAEAGSGGSGIQFTISAAAQRKSRWSSKDPASALFKQDTAESKLASQTAAPPAPAHNAYAAAQSPYAYAAATPAASTAWAQWQQQQQQQQTAASAAAFNAYNPQQTAAAAAPAATPAAAPAPATAVSYWASHPGLLEYVDRSLAQCPAHLKPQVETYLRELMMRLSKEGPGGTNWSTEPLAHLQVLGNVAQAKAKAAAVAAALAPAAGGGGKYVNFLAQQQQHQKGFKGTSSNTQPLGPRRSVPTGESKEEGDDSDDEQYIPLGKGKKRAWAATEDKNGAHGHVGKKSKKGKGKGQQAAAYDAVDLAKQSDRASRFRDYNEFVARSSNEGFKNPIQRHTFTAERGGGGGGYGDEDVELDWSSLHIQGTCQRLEKRYLRLTQAPDPADVRPEPVLQRALDMVLHKWRQPAPADASTSASASASNPNPDHLHDYKYTCEQLKSIRQDLTVQHCVHSPLTISVYEHHARIALEVGDFSEYNITQTQLKNLYMDNPDRCENQVEFVSYRVLYNLITNNQSALNAMLREIQSARLDQQQQNGAPVEPLLAPASRSAPTDPLSLAFAVSMAALQKDYFNFFRLYRSLPFQGPQILKPFVISLRFSALTTLMRAFKPGKVTLDFMYRVLGFDSEPECAAYLESTGVQMTNGIIDTKTSQLHEPITDEVTICHRTTAAADAPHSG